MDQRDISSTSPMPSTSLTPSQSAMPSTSAGSASTATPQCQTVAKRQLDGDDAETIPGKRIRYHYCVGGGSPIREVYSPESSFSYQGYETSIAMDTPDTDTKSEHEDSEEDVCIEYEIESLSDSENVPVVNDTSTGAEDFLAVAGAVTAVTCEPSIAPSSTDGGDSDNSSVAETAVHRIDYDMCVQCNLSNDNPLFRYCKKCFQARKTFFPPRPKGFKKKRKRKAGSIVTQTNSNSCSSIKQDDTKSITSGSSNFDDNIKKVDLNLEEKEKPGILLPGTLLEYKQKCIMCNCESKNSIFLHGSTAHMCCCYKCAMKSWKLNKKCPACNRKANNVVRVFEI